ncbi:hypothetical protein QP794_24140 [Paenibacillus sp. UMB7766-LJ446]|nr:hypothetical protein [Paenibacillus sp. UMB7766-LJ446]
MRRVLEPLVAVNDQSGHVFLLCKRFAECAEHEFIVVAFAHFVSHNFVIKQILYG